jgi:hypothetical protein
LGYQQHTPILNLIKNKVLNVKRQKDSKRRWLDKADVLRLPKLISETQSISNEDPDQWVI